MRERRCTFNFLNSASLLHYQESLHHECSIHARTTVEIGSVHDGRKKRRRTGSHPGYPSRRSRLGKVWRGCRDRWGAGPFAGEQTRSQCGWHGVEVRQHRGPGGGGLQSLQPLASATGTATIPHPREHIRAHHITQRAALACGVRPIPSMESIGLTHNPCHLCAFMAT